MLKIRSFFKYFSTAKRPVLTPGKTPAPKKRKVTVRKTALIGMTILLTVLIYNKNSSGKIQFLMTNNQINAKIIKRNPQLDKEKYLSTIYLPFGILQQLWAKYIQKRKFIKQTTQNYEGSVIRYIPVHNQIKNIEQAPCLIIVGGSRGFDQLMTDIMLHASGNRFEVIGINTSDLHDEQKLARVIAKLKSQRKNKNLYAVGIQYGANLLIITCANHPQLFKSVVSLGNPLDLNVAEKNVQNSWSAKFTFYEDMVQNRIKLSKLNLPSETNLYDIDKLIYGLNTQQQVKQWKQRHSSINYLNKLRINTLFLNSKQDPFSIDLSNEQRIQQNPLNIFVLTKNGGHNQWFSSLKALRWAPPLTIAYFKSIEKLLNEQQIPPVHKQ